VCIFGALYEFAEGVFCCSMIYFSVVCVALAVTLVELVCGSGRGGPRFGRGSSQSSTDGLFAMCSVMEFWVKLSQTIWVVFCLRLVVDRCTVPHVRVSCFLLSPKSCSCAAR
jgi:hypothetical protein